ncbi:hypothetical protein ACFOLA_01940 [Salinicoccus hispanicus]|uniref:Permease n=1 Tax=Salinicoccus hispanicus TaxID=157225 RepID=A0A6N8TZ72_9STAP|nr:hypothetical protein [Salinicoccus hispanicus]MXQ50347.1 hypothetical protein [Salinicoccus hispanicus]
MIQSPSFYIFSILAVIVISAIAGLALRRYIIVPIIVFIITALAAFIIPNFVENTDWEPLMGYALFLGILSFIISVLTWLYVRARRRKNEITSKRATKAELNDPDTAPDSKR